jgi:hypothetical protein
MYGNRRLIVVCLGLASFLALVLVGIWDPASLREAVRSKDPIETLFQGFIGAIITGVSLVLAINQLVLSQELGGVSDQTNRMEGAMNFYDNVEELIEPAVIPRNPSELFVSLLDEIVRIQEDLEPELTPATDMAGQELNANASEAIDSLKSVDFGSFQLISVVLTFNYPQYLNEVRKLQKKSDEFSEDKREFLARLESLLKAFGTTREHVKTLYFQWDLVRLSKDIIYTGVPALLISSGAILYLNDLGTITGSSFGVDHLLLTVTLLTTLSLVPFLVLVSYVVRVATVAQETLAIGPLSLR